MRGYEYGEVLIGEDGLNDTRGLCVVVWRMVLQIYIFDS
jgi:hypothetical protein